MDERDKPHDRQKIERIDNENKVIFASIGLIIFGGVIICLTFTPLYQAWQWEQNPTCDDLLICKTEKQTFTQSDTGMGKTIVNEEIIQTIKFSSRGIPTVNDQIDYDITLNTTKLTAIKKFYFLFITEKELSWLMTFEPNEVLEKQPWKHRLIEIPFVSKNKFHIKEIWETPSTPSNIIVIGYAVNEDESVYNIMKSDVVFSTVSQEVKIQDTANQETRITNKAVLGLTGIGIGLAFMLLGADFLVRVYLRE